MGGGAAPYSEKKKKEKHNQKALGHVYQFINEALLGVFRVSDM